MCQIVSPMLLLGVTLLQRRPPLLWSIRLFPMGIMAIEPRLLGVAHDELWTLSVTGSGTFLTAGRLQWRTGAWLRKTFLPHIHSMIENDWEAFVEAIGCWNTFVTGERNYQICFFPTKQPWIFEYKFILFVQVKNNISRFLMAQSCRSRITVKVYPEKKEHESNKKPPSSVIIFEFIFTNPTDQTRNCKNYSR